VPNWAPLELALPAAPAKVEPPAGVVQFDSLHDGPIQGAKVLAPVVKREAEED